MPNHRVLLIEDDALEAALALRTLRQINPDLQVTRLSDGAHFLDFCRSNPRELADISVAVMDLNMPKVDGHGVLKSFQDQKDRPPFPIILFSSSEDKEDVATAYKLGAAAFVNKPVAPKEYRAAMEHIVNFWVETNRR